MSDNPQQIENRTRTQRRSVTRDNAFPIEHGGGYFQILIPAIQPQDSLLPQYLPPDYRIRDRVLDSTPRADAMWSAAIGIAITKAAALAWDVKSEIALRSTRAQELLLNADATSISGIGGWVSYLGKQMRNYTCTNGGCYTEIIRATGAYGSRIVGLGHLSALRMRRTGDPEYPYIYIDRWGHQHVMRWWQVFNLVDMPDPDEAALGVGLCAAERAYQQIRKLAALEMYLYEKISGSRPLALHIVNGLTQQQLTDMMAGASNAQAQKGLSLYMGAIVATTLKPDAPPSLVTIPLAELPDGFEAGEERERADLIYANALGLDPQDLRPMANQQMGAGAQSQVLNQKAEGRGQAAYRQQLTHHLNQLVLDDKTKFLFTEHDYQDQQAAANVSVARGTFVTTLIDKQVISPQQGQQILAEQDEIPKAVLEAAAQGGTQLSDTDKPEVAGSLNDASTPPQPTVMPVMQQQAPTTVPPPASGAGNGAQPPKPLSPIVANAMTRKEVSRAGIVLKQHDVQAEARRLLRQARRDRHITEKGWVTIHGHPVLIGGAGGSGGGKGGGARTGGASKPASSVAELHNSMSIAGTTSFNMAQDFEDRLKKGNMDKGQILADRDAVVAQINKKIKTAQDNVKAAQTAIDEHKAGTKPLSMMELGTQHHVIEAEGDKLVGLRELKNHVYDISANAPKEAPAPKKMSTYVPKPGSGGSSKYPTLDAYKKGEISHEEALVKLKQDIKDAKLAGDTKAVNSLNSHYYAMKNGPHAPKATKPAEEHPDVTLAKNNLAKIKNDVAEAKAAGADPGLMKYYNEQIANHEAKVNALIAKHGGAPVAAPTPHAVVEPHNVSPYIKQEAHKITEGFINDEYNSAEMHKKLDQLANDSGISKDSLIGAAKLHDAQTFASNKQPPATAPKGPDIDHAKALIKDTPIHMHAQTVDKQIKEGMATPQMVADFHDKIAAGIAEEKNKILLADQSIASAKQAGFNPLSSVEKMKYDAEHKIIAMEGLQKHVKATEGLYGVKAPATGSIDPGHLSTAKNIAALHAAGTINQATFDANMDKLATKAGVSKADLVAAVGGKGAPAPVSNLPLSHLQQIKGIAETHKISDSTMVKAMHINEKYDNGEISLDEFNNQMGHLSGVTGVSTDKLSKVAYEAQQAGIKVPKLSAAGVPMADEKYLLEGAKIKKQYLSGEIGVGEYASKTKNISHAAGMDHTYFTAQVEQHMKDNPLGMDKIDIGGKTFLSTALTQDAHDWGKKYDALIAKLPASQVAAFKGYSRHGDQPINNFLRFGTLDNEDHPYESNRPSTVHKRIKALDAALKKTSVPDNVIVHRGFNNPELIARMTAGKDLNGAVFNDKAYVSTGVSKSGAFGGNPIITHIRVPKGAKGMYMGQPDAMYSNKGKLTHFSSETELLLPRNSHFKILGYTKVDNHWELEMEYLGDQDVPGAFKAEMF